jgi:hypothetical protein
MEKRPERLSPWQWGFLGGVAFGIVATLFCVFTFYL